MGYKFISRFNCFVGDSGETKPISADIGSILEELDTGKEYVWDSEKWVERIGQASRTKIWNTVSLAWEAATKGTGVGEAVEIQNFPAVISGSQVPITSDDPTFPYKITGLDTSGSTMYFGFVDKDGSWYIMRLTDTTGLYVKGSSDYPTNWGNRGTLSYDTFDVVF